MPWSWQLVMHPIDEDGRACTLPHQSVDLFSKVGFATWKAQAAVKIQKCARGKLARLRVNRRRSLIRWIHGPLIDEAYSLYESRRQSATPIQEPTLTSETCKDDVKNEDDHRPTTAPKASTKDQVVEVPGRIQACSQEPLWPLEGVFECEGMSSDAVRMEVQFIANPHFDESKHSSTNGTLAPEVSTEAVATRPLSRQEATRPLSRQEATRPLSRQGASEQGGGQEEDAGNYLYQNEARKEDGGPQDVEAEAAGCTMAEPGLVAGSMDIGGTETTEGIQAENELRVSVSEEGAPDRPEKVGGEVEQASGEDVWRSSSKESRGPAMMQEGVGEPAQVSFSDSAQVSNLQNFLRQVSSCEPAQVSTPERLRPRKSYAGVMKDGIFIRTMKTRLEDLSEEEKAQVLQDMADERQRKVEELMRRQKKHAAKRRKEQARVSKKMGQSFQSGDVSDEERKRKVRQLKSWLKKREEDEEKQQGEMTTMDRLEQTNLGTGDRRAHTAEQRRTVIAATMCDLHMCPRMLHRHVHHHVHYHDGASDEDAEGMPWTPEGGMRQSASAGDIRSASTTMAMRPLGHSSSAGFVGKVNPRATY